MSLDYSRHDGVGLAGLVARREVSPVELVDAAIATIERHNGALNAVVFKAYEEARRTAAGTLYFFQRVIQHGRRRAEAMYEVATTVEEIGLTPWSAGDNAERQAWVADLTERGELGDRADPEFARSADWRTEADRILRSLKR